MLYLTSADKELIENSYNSFLYNLKCFFESNQINSAIDCYKILSIMLRNGQFSKDGIIDFDDNFNYLNLPNLDFIGTQVMYGKCCCRHTSSFIKDIMLLLGFNTSLCYVHTNKDGNWRLCTPLTANHVVILLIENNEEYILDPMNNLLLKKNVDNSLISQNFDISYINIKLFLEFSDNNVQNISRVLRKYYHFRSMGINNVYD